MIKLLFWRAFSRKTGFHFFARRASASGSSWRNARVRRRLRAQAGQSAPGGASVVHFIHDQFACGRRFRILTIVDDVTRECLAAVPDTSISGVCVARELDAVIARRGRPGMIVSDHGTELTSNAILAWSKEGRIELHYTSHT